MVGLSVAANVKRSATTISQVQVSYLMTMVSPAILLVILARHVALPAIWPTLP